MTLISKIVSLIALLGISWVVMTFTHEVGHIAGGWGCGATLTDFDLAPWHLPFSLHSPDPHPLVTLWAGPIFGVCVPVVVALICRAWWLWFVADFCVLANGCYLAVAWFSGDRFLDTPRLLEAGTPPVWIAIYCLLCIGFGYVRFRKDCIKVLRPANPETTSNPQSPD